MAEEFAEELLIFIEFNCVTAEAIVKLGFMSPMMLLTVTEDSFSEMTGQVARLNPPNLLAFTFVCVNFPKGADTARPLTSEGGYFYGCNNVFINLLHFHGLCCMIINFVVIFKLYV
jgi:hypothetical protein